MGTSNESKRSESEEKEEIIPWSSVSFSLQRELIKKLNPDLAMSGNDWRMLASELGYKTEDITFFESEKENNTEVLFKHYNTKPRASLNEVCKALEKMNRQDCLIAIRNALPAIHEARTKELQKTRESHALEMSAARGELYQLPSSPCPCPYTHHPTQAYGSHVYHPFSHSVPGYGALCHSHHMGTCPPPYHTHSVHHSMCQTFGHLDTAIKTCESSLSSPCHGTPPVHDCPMKPETGCYGYPAQPVGSNSPSLHGNVSNNGHGTPRHHMMAACGLEYGLNNNDLEDSLTENKYVRLRYQNPPSLQHCGSSLNNAAMAAPVALAESLLRTQDNMLLPNISALDNSNLYSSDSSNSDSFNTTQKVVRQYSDECNVTQFTTGDKRLRNYHDNKTLGSDSCLDQHNTPLPEATAHDSSGTYRLNNSPKLGQASGFVDFKGHYHQQNGEVKLRNGQGAGYPDAMNRNNFGEAKNSLAHLENLARVPDKYKPTDDYKTVVAEQKIEEDRRKEGNGVMDSSASSDSSNGSSRSRNYHPSLPVRMTHEQDADNLGNLTSSQMPPVSQNMKPAAIRKAAFRETKVFVTYSYDNERHAKRVLSLCKFLQENGFACFVDVCEKESRSSEKVEWCKRKMVEADFVLVCISKKYLQDISSHRSTAVPSHNSERQLHTREIYELMNAEYINSRHENGGRIQDRYGPPQRYVPLLFPDMKHCHIPRWMKNGAAYSWPDQFKDLAWMLTKPQERMRRRNEVQKYLEECEGRDSELDVASGMNMTNLMSSVLCSS